MLKSKRNKSGSNKAVSTVIAVLLMIAVAVGASLIVYAWTMGYLNLLLGQTGKEVQIQSVALSNGNLLIYVQNTGQGSVHFNQGGCVYINGVLEPNEPISPTLLEGATAKVTVKDMASLAGTRVTIRVITAEGAFTELTVPEMDT